MHASGFWNRTAPLLASLVLLTGAMPATARTRLAIVGTGIAQSTAGNRQEAVRAMDVALRRYFESKGFEVRMLPSRHGRTLLTDRQLAAMGEQAGAKYVVYPKILSMGNQRDAVGLLSRGTGSYATLYARIVNPRARGRNRTLYFRQIGHTWSAPPSDVQAYRRPEAFVRGVSRLFQYFRRR